MRKLLFFAVLLVAGCGIQPTPVIQAGTAPTIRNPDNGSDLTLYFVNQGRVVASTRVTGTTLSPADALNMLLRGPNRNESDQGLYTELPPTTGGPISVDTRPFPAQIFIPFSLKELTDLAINQLACTSIAALATSGQVSDSGRGVMLTGTDGTLGPRPCQTF